MARIIPAKKINPEHYKCYKAEVRVKNRSTLRPDAGINDGDIIIVNAGWIIEDGPFEGQWAMLQRHGYWIPQEDLILLSEVPMKEYFN